MSAPLPGDEIEIPDDEIEITGDMLAAGVDKLREPFVVIDLAEGFLSPEEVVTAVYRAMFRASHAAYEDSGLG